MKKHALVFVVSVLLVGLTGCSQIFGAPREMLSLEQSPPEPGELVWSEKDFKKTNKKLKEGLITKLVMSGSGTRAPFFRDSDRNYTVYMYFDTENKYYVDLVRDFDKFTNVFFYENDLMMARGARTFDVSGRLVAEARLVRFLEREREPERFEVEEFHYGPEGDVVFTCISQYNDLGIKIGETEENGKKKRDYYFFWSVGI